MQPSLPLALGYLYLQLLELAEYEWREGMLAHEAWKDDIVLMLLGCRKCWCYQVLSFAHKNVFFSRRVLGFNPDERNGDRLEGKVSRVASIIFPQPLVIEKLNKLYQRQRWMSVQGIHNPARTAPSLGYARIRYLNWIGVSNNYVCKKRVYSSHLYASVCNTGAINFIRFRLGAWQIRVNDINFKSTARMGKGL